MTDRAASTKDIRKANRNALFRRILQSRGISRPELAARLSMSLPTVIMNVKSLIESGMVRETGCLESTGGRKATTLEAARDARVAVGLDITKNHLVAVIVDIGGGIVAKKRIRAEFDPGPGFVDRIRGLVDETVAASGVDRKSLLGAGISFPGILNGAAASSHILGVNGYPLSRIDEALGIPCLYANDANAAAFTETWGDDGDGAFVYLSLSNSVGGTIVWNGRPVLGANNRCGEFGHMTLERNGIRCYCGKRGCLDAYCSAAVLSERTGGDLGKFFEGVRRGQKELLLLWEDYLDYLASAVNSLRMIFDLDVVLGGYIGAHMDGHIEELRRRAAALNTFEPSGAYLRVCRNKTEASAVGAALAHIEQLILSV